MSSPSLMRRSSRDLGEVGDRLGMYRAWATGLPRSVEILVRALKVWLLRSVMVWDSTDGVIWEPAAF
jgi:hypothetical protein